ncbi:MAG: putative DNA binding domain-containing protein [Candidatus Riflebacteria bacterium]|nr:putative DNA binding domain-containing protein [Candidatus Riflebacteria bacterium]
MRNNTRNPVIRPPALKENQHIEFKESWRDEYLKWICGFANAEGGILVIGKNDKGEVVDVPNAEKLLEDIPNKVRDILGIMVEVNLREEAEKEYLEIVVEPYPYPVSYKGEYHYRSGSTKQELKGAALDKFLLRKQGKHWDGVPIAYVGLTDLDPLAIKTFRKLATHSGRISTELLAESDSQLIEKLHLMENKYLKRAATLLFHPDPEKFTTGAYVKIGFFRTDLLYHDVIRGNLFDQVEKVLDLLLTKYLRAGISYRGTQRIERFPIPDTALREALINAIAHKDYASGIPIQISVYDNKLMMWNPGPLPSDWSIDELLAKHSSKPANPDIANVFFRAGKIEAWGRGIDLIRNTCLEYGSPGPQFDYDGTGLWIEFPFSKISGGNNGDGLGDGLGDRLGDGLGDSPQSRIISLIKARPTISITELSQQLAVSTTAIEKSLKRLKDTGLLKRVGPRKGGHWEVLK